MLFIFIYQRVLNIVLFNISQTEECFGVLKWRAFARTRGIWVEFTNRSFLQVPLFILTRFIYYISLKWTKENWTWCVVPLKKTPTGLCNYLVWQKRDVLGVYIIFSPLVSWKDLGEFTGCSLDIKRKFCGSFKHINYCCSCFLLDHLSHRNGRKEICVWLFALKKTIPPEAC